MSRQSLVEWTYTTGATCEGESNFVLAGKSLQCLSWFHCWKYSIFNEHVCIYRKKKGRKIYFYSLIVYVWWKTIFCDIELLITQVILLKCRYVNPKNAWFKMFKMFVEGISFLAYFENVLTLSHLHDVPNVTCLPSTHADMTLRTSSPQRQIGKSRSEGILYYYAGRHERVK